MRPSGNPFASVTPELRARLHQGLHILLEALSHAAGVRRKPWDFAVKMATLRAAGLTRPDLRWLVDHGYVQHAVEKTKRPDKRRVFGRRGEILFHARSCFVLKEAAVRAARVLMGEIPFYGGKHELWARGRLLKQLERRAPDQDTVLSSFEELGWQERIDDPLPPKPGGRNPKLRLRDLIHRLNEKQQHPGIRFHGDYTGQGIRWEFEEEQED